MALIWGAVNWLEQNRHLSSCVTESLIWMIMLISTKKWKQRICFSFDPSYTIGFCLFYFRGDSIQILSVSMLESSTVLQMEWKYKWVHKLTLNSASSKLTCYHDMNLQKTHLNCYHLWKKEGISAAIKSNFYKFQCLTLLLYYKRMQIQMGTEHSYGCLLEMDLS